MKKSSLYKILLAGFMFLMTLRVSAPDMNVIFLLNSPPVDAYGRLINAVVQVESSGNTLAYNILEEATGAFQIRPIRIRDFNQRTGENIRIEECYNYEVSKAIFLYYAKLPEYIDYELIAKNWNGSGTATQVYWEKVRSKL
jgi:hypothetical protein